MLAVYVEELGDVVPSDVVELDVEMDFLQFRELIYESSKQCVLEVFGVASHTGESRSTGGAARE